jgi:hypothetical protein
MIINNLKKGKLKFVAAKRPNNYVVMPTAVPFTLGMFRKL